MTVTTASSPRALRLPDRAAAGLQWAVALVALSLCVGLAVAKFALHMSAASVLTGSMRPAFKPGDAVITKPVAVSEIRPGMVILAAPQGEHTAYAHRVTAVQHRSGS